MANSRFYSKLSLLILVLSVFTLSACTGKQNSLTEVMVTKHGYAIHGYDPVAYFASGEPAKGTESHSHQWQGATWLFFSEQHKQQFIETPEKFAPQYGGWCAYGASRGYAAETQPWDSWTIHDGKLYLNYNPEVVEKWSEDIPGYIEKANSLWTQLKDELNQGIAEVYWK